MINFRFHLVSLIAVFLAVGLGILVGSTVIDQKIVNRLESEIDSVRKENSERRDANKALTELNTTQQQFIDLTARFVADGRLDGQSVAIVAELGVDRDVLKQTETLLRAAGADVPAVLWLDDSWRLDTAQQRQALQLALNVHGDPSTMRARALDVLARRLGKRPSGIVVSNSTSTSISTSTSAPTTSKPVVVDTLAALEDAGFLRVTDGDASELATFPAHAARVLVVTGDDTHFLGTDVTSTLTRSLTTARLPTVVAAAFDPGGDSTNAPERGAALASVLDDRVLSAAVSTVDDLELEQGRVAAVLALEVVGNGNRGHYGYGSGASAPLPPHPS
jgi:hypothetical protein